MALSENQASTRAAMAEAFQTEMESLFPLPEEMTEAAKDEIRNNWKKLGQAAAAMLPAMLDHVVDNTEIGTVTSDVVGAEATQNNVGLGLLR
jgi:hypothetical protein